MVDPLTERVPVPIVGGVNRGRWWSLASAGSGYASGRRAAGQLALISELIQPDDVVWDVGAHHGYVTLLASERTGPAGFVHAFEPSRRNRRILERHLRWNGVTHGRVHSYALSSFQGETSFGGGTTSKMHSLGEGDQSVAVRTGASLVASGECRAPTFLKLDVEGAEGDVIEGLGDALPSDARLTIAVHSAEADRKCSDLLEARGFALLPSRELEEARSGPWSSDPDLIGIGPAYAELGETRELLEAARF